MVAQSELGTLFPDVTVSPPGPRSRELAEKSRRYESATGMKITAGNVPAYWDIAQGANIVDVDGNRYVDLTAGFTVALAGHSNPRIVAALSEQAARLMHAQGAANPGPGRPLLAERLAEVAPGDLSVSHIANTGAEAIEVALKVARYYTGRPNIISFHGGFHGKTIGALSATSQNYYREPFLTSLSPGVTHIPYAYCYRCPYGKHYPACDVFCADYLRYVLEMPDSGVTGVAAVILEPVQGHGGWINPPMEFVPKIRKTCDDHGILLISDEVITGFGRTGKWFGIQNFDITPDVIACGKGLASGFPIAAMITTPEISSVWKPLQHTSTFMGNPVGCAASMASLAEIEERGLVQRSVELGMRFEQRLLEMKERHPLIGDVRGIGSMMGIEIVRDRATKEPGSEEGARIVTRAMEKGVMITNYGGTYHNVIKMSPPLVITDEQIEVALDLLDESIGEVEAEQ